MPTATDNSASAKPPFDRTRRRLLLILIPGVCLVVLFFLGLNAAFSEESKPISIGTTTVLFAIDAKSSQEEMFIHESWDGGPGDFENGQMLSFRMPFALLKLGIKHDPASAIRKRLPSTADELIDLLDSQDPIETYCAAEALAQHPEAAITAFPTLLAAAERHGMLFPALEPIALAAQQSAVPALISGLTSTNSDFRHCSTALLGEIGTNAVAAVPALLAAFRTSDDPTSIAHALFRITGDCSVAIPKLRKFLSKGPSHDKHSILKLFETLGPAAAAALPEVLDSLDSVSRNGRSDFSVHAAALTALSRIAPDPEIALCQILSALDSSAPTHFVIRTAAIHALGNLGSNGVPHLLPFYRSTNEQQQAAATRALAKIGPPVADFLDSFRDDLNSGKPDRVALACQVLVCLGERSGPITPALFHLLHAPSSRIRVQAANTLHKLGYYNDTMVRVLVDSLGEKHADVSPHTIPSLTVLMLTISTNGQAKAVLDQRLCSNPRAKRFLQQQRDLFQRHGVSPLR